MGNSKSNRKEIDQEHDTRKHLDVRTPIGKQSKGKRTNLIVMETPDRVDTRPGVVQSSEESDEELPIASDTEEEKVTVAELPVEDDEEYYGGALDITPIAGHRSRTQEEPKELCQELIEPEEDRQQEQHAFNMSWQSTGRTLDTPDVSAIKKKQRTPMSITLKDITNTVEHHRGSPTRRKQIPLVLQLSPSPAPRLECHTQRFCSSPMLSPCLPISTKRRTSPVKTLSLKLTQDAADSPPK